MNLEQSSRSALRSWKVAQPQRSGSSVPLLSHRLESSSCCVRCGRLAASCPKSAHTWLFLHLN